jgi:hypothetical protein
MLMLFFLYSSLSIVGTACVSRDFKVVSLSYCTTRYTSVFFCIMFLLLVRTYSAWTFQPPIAMNYVPFLFPD